MEPIVRSGMRTENRRDETPDLNAALSNPNPQKEQMSHESMDRCLAAQAEAIWPEESRLLQAYELNARARILDAGSGTGQFATRLHARLPQARITGIDILPERIAPLRAQMTPGLTFALGDIFQLDFDDATFDLVACRHVLQSIPEPERALAELARVIRPGGRIHLLAEDYGMLHFHPTRHDLDLFFHNNMRSIREQTGVNYESGRHAPFWLETLGFKGVAVNYVIVDTLRVARPILREMFIAWRDGYTGLLAEMTGLAPDLVRERFEDMIACVSTPPGYAVWFVPIVTGIKI